MQPWAAERGRRAGTSQPPHLLHSERSLTLSGVAGLLQSAPATSASLRPACMPPQSRPAAQLCSWWCWHVHGEGCGCCVAVGACTVCLSSLLAQRNPPPVPHGCRQMTMRLQSSPHLSCCPCWTKRVSTATAADIRATVLDRTASACLQGSCLSPSPLPPPTTRRQRFLPPCQQLCRTDACQPCWHQLGCSQRQQRCSMLHRAGSASWVQLRGPPWATLGL